MNDVISRFDKAVQILAVINHNRRWLEIGWVVGNVVLASVADIIVVFIYNTVVAYIVGVTVVAFDVVVVVAATMPPLVMA